MKTMLTVAIGLMLLVASAGAADYFVATDGDDANPGTLAKPWRDPVKAAARLGPGDTLNFREGDYKVRTNSTVGLAPSRDGTADRPITFRNHNNEHVRINVAASNWGVTPNGYNHIIFDGLSITGSHYGMKISAASGRRAPDGGLVYSRHITVRNCEVHNTGGECIFSYGTEHLTIENCHLHNSRRSHGLYLQVGCNHAVIRNVTSENNHGNSGIQLNAAGGGICNVLVENCLIRNNAHGLSLMQVENSVFRNNVLYNNGYDGPRGSGNREIIAWTYDEHGNKGQPCRNLLFEHNTIINTRPRNISHLLDIKVARNLTFRNNILAISADRPIMTVAAGSEEGLVFSGNLWQASAKSQVAFGGERLTLDQFLARINGDGGGNVRGDARLVAPEDGDFSPRKDSPAVGKARPSTQPDAAAARRTDIGAVQAGKGTTIGSRLPWQKAPPSP